MNGSVEKMRSVWRTISLEYGSESAYSIMLLPSGLSILIFNRGEPVYDAAYSYMMSLGNHHIVLYYKIGSHVWVFCMVYTQDTVAGILMRP